MRTKQIAIVLALLMVGASVGAIYMRPSTKAADIGQAISLESMIPKRFGEWREVPSQVSQVVNPQTKELLDKIYSQILSRTYVHSDGYRVMISLAYGSDQRGSLQAHRPEVCYPAQGFKLHKSDALNVSTPVGDIAAQRLFTSLGPRQEPVTYWFTVGEKVIRTKFEKRMVELSYWITGRIPDGLLFRISSLDSDQERANRYHDHFVNQLLLEVPAADRVRLSGLGT